jgi:hypothetical protein
MTALQKLHYENVCGVLLRTGGLLSWSCPDCARTGTSEEVLERCPECYNVTFCSIRGNLYGPKEVRRIVKARLARRWGIYSQEGWRARVDEAFADVQWVRGKAGCTPSALMHDLEHVVYSKRSHRQP